MPTPVNCDTPHIQPLFGPLPKPSLNAVHTQASRRGQ